MLLFVTGISHVLPDYYYPMVEILVVVYQLVALVCPLIIPMCPLAVVVVLSVGLFITDLSL